MDYLLISGAPNTGKTEVVYDITAYLIRQGYKIKEDGLYTKFVAPKPVKPAKIEDFQVLLQKKEDDGKIKTILVNSPSDNDECLRNFKQFYNKHPNVDIVITSIRAYGTYNIDDMRTKFWNFLNPDSQGNSMIELPLAKLTQRYVKDNAIELYQGSVNKVIEFILKNHPYSI
jgi:KaiC/GvpD/RAD55 family RecA-like ATPase